MSTLGTVVISGEISSELYSAFLSEFLELEGQNDRIIVYLDSPGGDVRAALSLYDLLSTSKCEIIGVVAGQCYSAANIVLQACSSRNALPNACFMIHAGTSELSEVPYNEFPAAVRLDKHEMELADRLTLARAKDTKTLKRLYKRGEYFDATAALQTGLIDSILTERI